ncbi:t1pks [Epichloe bromicola]|uniref:T1pks n=1 Tax=Epichloe bromicola TaxID=79588 RepID=A0ABQ0CR57_9HYPO
MSIAVWPPISPEELRRKAAESLDRDLQWIVRETISLCHELKHSIEDCYALLAPIDPGSTLVMSTHRNEKVKGTITRVGTRIIKGTINLQLRTLPPSQINLSPSEPIHVPALDALHTHLTQAIDLLGLTLSSTPTASSLASALAVLSESISESRALLKGTGDSDADPAWQTSSCPAHHFSPPLPSNLSFYVALQDSSIVLWLRALEPAHLPVHFGTKLGLAIGTFRRLEHDEMDVVFKYHPEGDGGCEPKRGGSDARGPRMSGKKSVAEEVFVREKVRVESADPSLISLYSKLGQLGNMLGLAGRNLAAIMGEDPDV